MADLMQRLAGAPITWGVDGSPGWGHLMDPDRVLAEMVEIGLRATELGPDGWLGEDTAAVLERLDRHGLELVGGFVPVVLYDDDRAGDDLEYFERASQTLVAGGASVAVVGADSHLPGYDEQVALTAAEWDVFFRNLAALEVVAERCGITPAVHPHWGMAVEDQADIDQLMDRSGIGYCLDTGHLALAGVDIGAFVAQAGDRIHHVHLKDLDVDAAARVRSGEVGFRRAVIEGLFTPLGEGGVGIDRIVLDLEAAGFDGWYVLEQDVALTEDPPPGAGPVEGAARSVELLRRLADQAGSSSERAAG